MKKHASLMIVAGASLIFAGVAFAQGGAPAGTGGMNIGVAATGTPRQVTQQIRTLQSERHEAVVDERQANRTAVQGARTDLKNNIANIKNSSSTPAEKRGEIMDARKDFRGQVASSTAGMREDIKGIRASSTEAIRELREERSKMIKKNLIQSIEHLSAAADRLTMLATRMAERLNKLASLNINTTDAKAKLDTANAKITDAKTKLGQLQTALETANAQSATTTDPSTTFKNVKDMMQSTISSMKDAQKSLEEVLKAMAKVAPKDMLKPQGSTTPTTVPPQTGTTGVTQ